LTQAPTDPNRGTSARNASIEQRPARWLFLSLPLAGAFLLNLAMGSVHIPVGDIIAIVTGGDPARDSWRQIFVTVRLPRALAAALAGAALAIGRNLRASFDA